MKRTTQAISNDNNNNKSKKRPKANSTK